MRKVVPFLASKKLQAATTAKAQLCDIFRAFLRKGDDVPCPSIDGVLDGVVMCLKFQRLDGEQPVPLPNFGTETRGATQEQHVDAVLPHPFLLFLRTLNAWFNYLHKSEKWPEWKSYLNDQALPIGTPPLKRKLTSNDPLVILPSCCDMDIDSCTCVLCKAADVCENAELYPALPDGVWQAAMAAVNPAGSPITDEEALQIAELRRIPPEEMASCVCPDADICL